VLDAREIPEVRILEEPYYRASGLCPGMARAAASYNPGARTNDDGAYDAGLVPLTAGCNSVIIRKMSRRTPCPAATARAHEVTNTVTRASSSIACVIGRIRSNFRLPGPDFRCPIRRCSR
jgi:hypothetical protein